MKKSIHIFAVMGWAFSFMHFIQSFPDWFFDKLDRIDKWADKVLENTDDSKSYFKTRNQKILDLKNQGLSNYEIAEHMELPVTTVSAVLN